MNRQPAGVPSGGQFAPSEHSDTGVRLDELPRPSFPVKVSTTMFQAGGPGVKTVDLANPPPHPQIGCDWTDPTRDFDAGSAVDHRSWSDERRMSVEAVMSASMRRISSGPVQAEAAREIEAWDEWAYDRFRSTGDPYFEEFRSGLTAGRLALAPGDSPDGSKLVLTEWQDTGMVDAYTASAVSHRFPSAFVDDAAVDRWSETVDLAYSTSHQDGALMVGRVLGNVPTPART